MSGPKLPSLADFEHAEHCVLEDVTIEHPAIPQGAAEIRAKPRQLVEEIIIRDRIRGRLTGMRLFTDGWMDFGEERRRLGVFSCSFDLRFLNPKPSLARYRPLRLLKAAGILAAVTAVLSLIALFGLLTTFTGPAALVVGLTAAGTAFWAFYLTRERIQFQTLNGRVTAIRFEAGLGTIHRYRRLVPKIAAAINQAAVAAGHDRSAFLRAEMRDHYRLRTEGVISEADCAAATGRILNRFDQKQ
jgi:hypothetical protein